ncbi:MAG: CHASE2 domain-containing protein [Steroidobacteraceae bacterium]|nr:CHASE2 domain-containing protein [Deltaproteobacteria bacterium]
MPSLIRNSRRSLLRSGRSLILAAGFILTLALCALSLAHPAFLGHLDGRFFDGLISDGRPPGGDTSPVVVALDDESLARFGRWPWPRTLVAELLTRIAAQQPASVGIDAIFAERELPPSANSSAAASNFSAGDMALAKALAGGPFVLGFELTFAPTAERAHVERLLHPLNFVSVAGSGAVDPRRRLWQATGVVSSLPDFSRSVSGAGFVNAAMEQDGVLRKMPVLIMKGEKVYPSLALATVLRSAAVSEAILASTWNGDSSLQIGGRRIPLDDRGRLLLRYRGWHGTVTPLSAWKFLEGSVPQGALRGRVVFVGATATGMGEAVVTPLNSLLSGVQVHAIAAENILNGDFARICPWVYRLLATLALGALATLVCFALPVMRGALLLGVTAIAAWQGSVWLFQASGLFLSPVLPLLALLANFSLLSLIRSFFVEKKGQRQSRDLAATREFIMTSLAALTEIRDTETGAHIMRTQRYLLVICQELSRCPRFQHLLDQDTIELISKLAPLHDIGKVGLPDHLLHKTSAFTAEEYEEVKKHAAFGRDAIAKAESRAGIHDDVLLQYAKDMAYSHHERWDGSGYPEGLRGEQIPWPGRIMAVADAYDAIISRRVYKEPIPHETAVGIIVEGRGILFDPDIVDAFVKVEDQWRRIACELVDEDDREVFPCA